MKFTLGLLGAACLAAATLVGCGGGANGTATTSSASTAGAGQTVVIGIIGKSVSNPVFQAAHAGAQDAARELGPKYHRTVQIEIRTPPDEDANAQANAIQNMINEHVNGIAISCSNAATLTPAINRAVSKGIAVMCFDSDAPDSKRMCYYGTDDIACGTETMKYLAQFMGDKGTVAILAGSPDAPNLRNRVKGAEDELKKYPNMHEISRGPVHHKETASDAAQALQQTQRSNPEINGWCLIGGWPLFTRDALPWPAGTVKVVSVDALPAELAYLKDGHVQLLLAQDCYGWGHKSVEILLNKIVDHKDPAQTRMIDPLTKVTKDNADAFSKNWDKWLKH